MLSSRAASWVSYRSFSTVPSLLSGGGQVEVRRADLVCEFLSAGLMSSQGERGGGVGEEGVAGGVPADAGEAEGADDQRGVVVEIERRQPAGVVVCPIARVLVPAVGGAGGTEFAEG